jgi:hypothetical protein
MRALESLTPSGSEFVDDVERCVQFIRDQTNSRWQHILKLTKENKELSDKCGGRIREDLKGGK